VTSTGRLKTLISAMPINTPERKNGSQSNVLPAFCRQNHFTLSAGKRRQYASTQHQAERRHTVAAMAANQNEFQIAPVPASTAPGNSTHVRFTNVI